MLDSPPAALLVAEARKALDAGLDPGFPQKVAANALGIAQRELEQGPALAQEERERLKSLLVQEGNLNALNAELAKRIRSGGVDLGDDDLIAHLILTTIAKVSIDQPGYPGFRALA